MPKSTKKHLWDTQINKLRIIKYYLSITYMKLGLTTVEVRKEDAQTLKAGKDTGEWADLDALLALVEEAGKQLEKAIANQSDWVAVIETKEFGKKTKAEAFGRITTHTAYHAGQSAFVVKYGE
jgi:hypothetical protein